MKNRKPTLSENLKPLILINLQLHTIKHEVKYNSKKFTAPPFTFPIIIRVKRLHIIIPKSYHYK